MTKNTILIVGLGNPGEQYANTPHNAGFLVVDQLLSAYDLKLAANNKLKSEVAEGKIGNRKIILAKPQTFMNKSGEAVKALALYYKIPPLNAWVIHDDVDLELSQIKIVRNRGSAGHKGVEDIIRKFKTKYNKIASAMIIHYKLLETVAKEKKYTFISTGMSTMNDIKKAVNIFKKYNCRFELLPCHSAYPMPSEEANLRMIPTLAKKFKCKVGYSGHEVGATNISIPAVMIGATTIERHITIDRIMYGHDQAASLEPAGLHRLVRDIRLIDKILGDGKKKIYNSEIPSIKKLRQKFV